MPDLDLLRAHFAENFAARGELGASVSVWQDGREVLSLAEGWRDREKTRAWTVDTPVLVWSATKGPAAACALHACGEAGVGLDSAVTRVWPEFAQAGKGAVTVAQLLSHQAGLPVLDREVPVTDRAAVVAALEAQAPAWEPGTAHGYHPRTFGFLLDELVRRVSGLALGEYWRRHFAEPLGLDFWIGVPPERAGEVAPVFAARSAPPGDDPFYRAFATAGSFTQRAFASPRGLHSVSAMNTPEARTATFPAFGGVGTARALGKFYAMLAGGGAWEGRAFFRPALLAWMTQPLANGPDRTLLMDTAFSAGFMQDPLDRTGRKTRAIFGPSRRAFGHPGAGGSLAFADPERDLAFAYAMNQMEAGVLPNAKSLRLVEALYDLG